MASLTYRFKTENLSAVRRAFRQVESDLDDISAAEDEVRQGLADIEEQAADAASAIQRRMDEAVEAIDQTGTDAQDAAETLEESWYVEFPS